MCGGDDGWWMVGVGGWYGWLVMWVGGFDMVGGGGR